MSKVVLVIEDELSLLRAIKLVLTKNGFKVLSASNGAQGLALESEANVILLDVAMPVMDGAEFLAKRKSKCPVIMFSNYEESGAKAVFKLKNNYNRYMIKANTSIHEMVEAVKELT